MGKRTPFTDFKLQNRGGKGVKCYKISDKTGEVVGAKAVNDGNEIMMITTEGIIIRLQCSDISILGRITSGVKLINLSDGVTVASFAKVREKDEDKAEKESSEYRRNFRRCYHRRKSGQHREIKGKVNHHGQGKSCNKCKKTLQCFRGTCKSRSSQKKTAGKT